MRKNRAIALLGVLGFALTLMAATRTINPVAITANVEKDSGAAALPSSVHNVFIQLTDSAGNTTPLAGSNWLTTAGNIKIWGVQRSTDGGATWSWGPIFQGSLTDSTTWIPFGSLSRDGSMSALNISSDLITANSGDLLRLGIVTDTNITLGAKITPS